MSNISEQILKLPKGYISKKRVGEKIYYYHQWSEKGKKQSRYLKDEEVNGLSSQIELRKELQEKLNQLKHSIANKSLYVLMHKDISVMEIELDETSGFIKSVISVHDYEHVPIGIRRVHKSIDCASLNGWWVDRSIPESRSGIKEALNKLDLESTKELLIACYGLSLSDQYWICPKGSNIKWENINFFDHDFSLDIGDILFGQNKNIKNLNLSSPDNTSDGNLKKRWKIINGKRCLIKGGSNPYRQQPFNEVIASKIMDRLDIPHVNYSFIISDNVPYSVCEDFISKDTELIPAWRIMQLEKKSNNISNYQHFVNCANKLGIPNVISSLDRMITIDFIIANEDRHFNNFGAIRDAKSLKWIGMAPIYDSGSCLGYDKLPALIINEIEVTCKPFKTNHIEQLKLVTSFDWLDVNRLNDLEKIVKDVLSSDEAKQYVDKDRLSAIVASVNNRISYLKSFIRDKKEFDKNNIKNDVKDNIAAKY